MDQVREVMRYYHYAYRTEQTYCQWILWFIYFFGGKTHPRKLGARDIERFLSDLAVNRSVAASTQRQALNAIVFLYREVLNISLEGKLAPIRSKKKPKTVTVISKEEASRLFLCCRLKIFQENTATQRTHFNANVRRYWTWSGYRFSPLAGQSTLLPVPEPGRPCP